MSEFEHSTSIDASPDEVYAFMSKVENLPKYLPTTHSAQPQEGERVRVQAKRKVTNMTPTAFSGRTKRTTALSGEPTRATTRAGYRSKRRVRPRA